MFRFIQILILLVNPPAFAESTFTPRRSPACDLALAGFLRTEPLPYTRRTFETLILEPLRDVDTLITRIQSNDGRDRVNFADVVRAISILNRSLELMEYPRDGEIIRYLHYNARFVRELFDAIRTISLGTMAVAEAHANGRAGTDASYTAFMAGVVRRKIHEMRGLAGDKRRRTEREAKLDVALRAPWTRALSWTRAETRRRLGIPFAF